MVYDCQKWFMACNLVRFRDREWTILIFLITAPHMDNDILTLYVGGNNAIKLRFIRKNRSRFKFPINRGVINSNCGFGNPYFSALILHFHPNKGY